MAKFCTKCGKETVDGVCPDCKNSNDTKKEEVSSSANQSTTSVDVSSYINDYLEISKNIFKKPVEVIGKFAKADKYVLGIISMIITALFGGLFVQYLIKGILGDTATALGAANTALASLGVNITDIGSGLLFKIALYMLVLSAITTVAIWLMHEKLYKKKVDFKKIISIVGVCQVPFALGLAIAFVLTFFISWLAPVVALFASLAYFVNLHIALNKCSDLSKNEVVMTHIVGIVIPAVIFIVLCVSMTLMAITMKSAIASIGSTGISSTTGLGL